MKPEAKAKWVAALRSGEYKQGDNWLYNPVSGKYCCLGVLLAVHKMPLGDSARGLLSAGERECFNLRASEAGALTLLNDGGTRGAAVQHIPLLGDWLGFKKGDKASCKMTFNQIADIVEKHL